MVVMGRVVAPYGVEGWVKVQPFTASRAALLGHRCWWLAAQSDREIWKEFAVLAARVHGDGLVAQLAGLSDREAARCWRGASLGVPREALPEPSENEIYLADLLGLKVINRAGETLGEVSGFLETGAHAVLRVACEAGERLIPLVPAYVDAIEPASGVIQVDWHKDY